MGLDSKAIVLFLVVGLIAFYAIRFFISKLSKKKDKEKTQINPKIFEPVYAEEPLEEEKQAGERSDEIKNNFAETFEAERKINDLLEKIKNGGNIPEGTILDHDLDLSSETCHNDIVLDRLTINGDVTFEDSTIRERISMIGTRIKGNLNLDAEADKYDLAGIIIDGNLILNAKAPLGVDLSDAYIGGDLEANDSEFEGMVNCQGIEISDSFKADGGEFHSLLDISYGKIGGHLDLENSEMAELQAESLTVSGELILRNASCSGEIKMQNVDTHDTVYLSELDCKGNVHLSGPKTKIRGDLKAPDIECKKFDISHAVIDGDVELENSQMEILDISDSQSNNLNLEEATFKEFIYSGAVIEEDLNLEGVEIDVFPGMKVKGSISM